MSHPVRTTVQSVLAFIETSSPARGRNRGRERTRQEPNNSNAGGDSRLAGPVHGPGRAPASIRVAIPWASCVLAPGNRRARERTTHRGACVLEQRRRASPTRPRRGLTPRGITFLAVEGDTVGRT